MPHFSLPDFSKHIASIVKEIMYNPTYETIAVAPSETSANFKPVSVLFEEQVALNQFSTCLIYGDTTISFNEVNTRANQLARYLIAKGITTNQSVPLCIDRSIEFVIAMLAILKAGGVYVPVDISVPRDRIQFILMDLAASCIICSKESSSLVNDFNVGTIAFEIEIIRLFYFEKQSLACHAGEEILFLYQYPNGSTIQTSKTQCFDDHIQVAKIIYRTNPGLEKPCGGTDCMC